MFAQALGNAGTIEGTVTDPSGAILPNAKVTILNRITNYQQTATTDSKGTFRLTNIPPNPYHVEVSAPNFAISAQDVDVRSTVPVSLKISHHGGWSGAERDGGSERRGPTGECPLRAQRRGYFEPVQTFGFIAGRGRERRGGAEQRSRGCRFQRILPPARGSCADQLLGGRAADRRSAEQGFLHADSVGRDSIDGIDHGDSAGRVRR